MSFGLNPHFTQQLDQGDLSREQFIVIGIETAKRLGWSVEYISKSGFIALTPYSFSSSPFRIQVLVEEGTASVHSELTGSQLYDWGKNKKNVALFVASFADIKAATSDEELNALVEKQQSVFNSPDKDLLDPENQQQGIKSFLSFFIPSKSFFVTPIIVDLNILVFILMVISGVSVMLPDTAQLLAWGASFRPAVLEGDWWRLFTNVFIHIGLIHLLFNMYALVYVGVLLEPYLGKQRFIVAYLLTGLVGSVASVYWHPLTVSAGASGAIFGMYGVFLALLSTNIIEKTVRKPLLTSIVIFVVYNLANGMKSGIDNAAHIGGLLSGLILGYSYYPSISKPEQPRLKYITIAASAVVILTISFFIYHNIPDDVTKFDKAMITFSQNEEDALKVFQLSDKSPKTEMLNGLSQGIKLWKSNLALSKVVDSLDLPKELLDRNTKLKRYCNLRIQSYSLLYKLLNEGGDLDSAQMKEYNTQIQNVIDELKESK